MKRELTEKRNLTSKEIDNGDGTHTISLHRHPIHFLKDGQYEDIDLTLIPTAQGYEMRKANYNLIITDTPGQTRIKFVKEGEWIEFVPNELRWINDEGEISVVANFDNSIIGDVVGNEITWKNAFGFGIDLLYGCAYAGIYKKVVLTDFIEAPDSIKSGTNAMLEVALKYTKSPIGVKIDGAVFKGKKEIRLENVRFGDLWELKLPKFGDNGSISQYAIRHHEDIGIRVISSNEITTSAPYDWLVKAIYPAYIDTDINEQIGLGTDDCEERDDTSCLLTSQGIQVGYIMTGPYSSASADGGFRWQTVNIPNGSTISAAKLSLYMTGDNGTLKARIIGIDEDNTATWSSGSRPSQRSKTTATISADEADWNNWATSSWIDIDISSVIKEIIDRPGWSANNALAVVAENLETGSVYNNVTTRAYEYSGNAHGAKLDVTYTVPTGIARSKIDGGLAGRGLINGGLIR